MIVLKILGIALAAIILLIFTALMLKLSLSISYSKEEDFSVTFRVLCFSFGKKSKTESGPGEEAKPEKKSSIAERFKKLLGLDSLSDSEAIKQDVEAKGIADAVTRLLTVVTLLAGRIAWIIRRSKIKRLKLTVVCGDEDAADAAIGYGLVCAAVYPFCAALTTNLKTAKNAEEVGVYCDFNGESKIDFNLTVSVRIIHLVRALYHTAMARTE